MAIGRQFFPFVSSYKHDLEIALTEQLAIPVEIGSIEGSWRWLDPVLIISDINLKSDTAQTGSSELHLDSFYIHLSVLQSILKRKLQFQSIEAKGLTLPLKQGVNGEWNVPGFSEKNINESDAESDFSNLLSILEQPSLLISGIQLELSSAKGLQTSWRIPSAIMAYDGQAFSAMGELLQHGSDASFIRFSAKGAGWIFSRDFTGKLYVDWASDPFLNEYLNAYEWNGINFENIDASGRLWLDILQGRVLSLQGELDVDSMQWRNEEGVVAPLQNVKADFFWSQIGQSSILSIYDLSMEWEEHRWAPSNYSLLLSDDLITIKAQEINVSLLTDLLLATKILPKEGHDELAGYRPAGYIENLDLTIPLSPVVEEPSEPSPLFTLKANLVDLSSQGYSGAPGGDGMTGYISMDDLHGSVMVDSDNFKLTFPDLFKEGWLFKKSQVSVKWDITETDLTVYSEGINLFLSEDSLITGDFSVLVSDVEENILSLQLGLQNVDALRTYQFVPYYLVSPGLYDWLKSSIKGGVIESGLYVGYGSIEGDAPPNSFTSSMFYNTKGARVLFDPEWPELEGVDSRVFLQNGFLDLDASSVSFRGGSLTKTEVDIVPDATGKESILKVSTRVKPSASDIKYWLNESPISEHTKEISEQLMLNGDIDVAVRLDIPLDNINSGVEYDLSFELNDLEVTHKPTDLIFERSTGALNVSSEKGLSAEGIKLNFLGQPVILDIASKIESSALTSDLVETTLSMTGEYSTEHLNEYFLPDQTLPITGSAKFFTTLVISSDASKNPLLTINSPLTEVALELPPPLSMAAGEDKPLSVALELSDSSIIVDVLLRDIVTAKAEISDADFKKGMISWGGGKSKLPEKEGLYIKGDFEQLNAQSWIEYLTTQKSSSDDNSTAIEVDLSVGNINFYDQHFSHTNINIQPVDNEWAITLVGSDIDGTVHLPSKGQKLNIALNKLKLSDKGAETLKESESLEQDLSPFDIPEMSVLVEQLSIGDVNYGHWSADVVHKENGVVAKDIAGTLAGANFSGRLTWIKDVYGVHSTILTVSADGGDLASLSEEINRPAIITSKHFSTELALVWGGAPTEFEISDLSGRISLLIEDGTMKEAKSATEAFKVFGILNAEAITRRIKLDFSDLYQKGLGYDRIDGTARIDKGLLVIEEPLGMKGPSSAYKFTGSADLKNQTLNMDMVVVLPLTKNLPLAALFLGAPQIGGAVWVIDKLLGEPLSKLTSATYKMKGSWDNPEIKLKNVFDRTGSNNKKNKHKNEDDF